MWIELLKTFLPPNSVTPQGVEHLLSGGSLSGMMDPPVSITVPRKDVIDRGFIGEDHAFGKNSFLNHRDHPAMGKALDFPGMDVAFSLDHSGNNRLSSRAASLANLLVLVPVLGLSAHIGFVGFKFPVGWFAIAIVQHGSDLLEHPPCGFVGDSGFPLNLLGRDSAARRRHEVDRVEPKPERSRGLVVDRVRRWVDMVPAEIATVGRPAGDPMVLRHPVADFAANAIRVQVGLEPFQASGIGGEHRIEVPDGKFLAWGLVLFWHD